MAYRVTLKSFASDGTNIYCEMEITNGEKTFPMVRPSFPEGTTAAAITEYMQTIANNQPTLDPAIAALLNVPTVQA
jgi:hypothetical protein